MEIAEARKKFKEEYHTLIENLGYNLLVRTGKWNKRDTLEARIYAYREEDEPIDVDTYCTIKEKIPDIYKGYLVNLEYIKRKDIYTK